MKCVTKSDRKFQYSYSTDTKTHCLLSGINFVLHCWSSVNLSLETRHIFMLRLLSFIGLPFNTKDLLLPTNLLIQKRGSHLCKLDICTVLKYFKWGRQTLWIRNWNFWSNETWNRFSFLISSWCDNISWVSPSLILTFKSRCKYNWVPSFNVNCSQNIYQGDRAD